jgi:hypothetical protein
MSILSDEEIIQLIQEPKPFPDGLDPLKNVTVLNGHRRKEVRVTCDDSGHEFVVYVRQLLRDPMKFSVILGYELPDVHRIFRFAPLQWKAPAYKPAGGGEL